MVSAVCFLLDKNKLRSFRINNLPDWTLNSKIMEVKIKNGEEMIDATIEMVDGFMVVSPKKVKFEPKDGDVVTYLNGGKPTIYIYKGGYKYNTSYYLAYSTSRNQVFLTSTGYLDGERDDIRPATEKEKQKLFDKLKEEGYEWDTEKKEVVKIKWKPVLGEVYFRIEFVDHEFRYADWTWKNSTYEIEAY